MAITLTLIAIVLFSCILADKFSGKFGMPANSLAIMIKRNGDTIIPNGDTKILGGDNIILSVPSYEPSGK